MECWATLLISPQKFKSLTLKRLVISKMCLCFLSFFQRCGPSFDRKKDPEKPQKYEIYVVLAKQTSNLLCFC